ncbi:MAG: hypothetical protein K6F90_02980 [Lachnospiraceae bacterium]|nr:hypothetical protein [Lachnospiraceae bacterium]
MAEYNSKYKIGDFVLYGLNGTCKIVDIGPLDFGGPDKIYYSMKPVSDARSTIYLPLTKEEEILRGVMSKDEAKQVVEGIKKSKPATYSPVRENCDVILKSGDNVAVSSMIKLLRNMRKENRKIHKGLNIQEEKILKDAERVLFSEISIALDMPYTEAVTSIGEILDV